MNTTILKIICYICIFKCCINHFRVHSNFDIIFYVLIQQLHQTVIHPYITHRYLYDTSYTIHPFRYWIALQTQLTSVPFANFDSAFSASVGLVLGLALPLPWRNVSVSPDLGNYISMFLKNTLSSLIWIIHTQNHFVTLFHYLRIFKNMDQWVDYSASKLDTQ